MNAQQTRQIIARLRFDAAQCMRSTDAEVRDRGVRYLSMVQKLKVQMLASGENVTVTSREGRIYRAR